jgi:RimJ/RimL family protein N-acetyltransferase
MLRGQVIGLRARRQADVPILHAALHDDVETTSRSDARPWQPVSVDSADSQFAVDRPRDNAAPFSVVTLDGDELVGDAVLWGMDLHNRYAHVGLSMLPEYRGRGWGKDVVSVLCYYGFSVRGFHRLQVDTLADNAAMIAAAEHVGFRQEARFRESAWVAGQFVDEVILGLLVEEWTPPTPRS